MSWNEGQYQALPEAAPCVLVVDDDPINLEMLVAYLEQEQYRVLTAASGPAALALVRADLPDLILLDAMMPGMDGFTVCARLKSSAATRLIPVVMVTALSAMQDRIRGIEAGVDDFLSKPLNRQELLTRCHSLIRFKGYVDELESAEHVILTLARAIEARDGYTEQHTERVTARAVALGRHIGLPAAALEVLHRGCMLHDIGKIGVPESILSKPGKLTDEEFALMRTHPEKGVAICSPLRSRLIAQALPIVRHHHERVDGMGYPDRLRDRAIPLLARIAAIADAYDAMVSDRPYRQGMSTERALAILDMGAGTQWDRELVAAFMQLDARTLDSALMPVVGVETVEF